MVTEIDRAELKQKLDHPRKHTLLDALPADHYERGHLPGALNLPPDQVQAHVADLVPNKESEVIVYCAGPSCHASADVARQLSKLGYSNVRHYAGGKEDWVQAGFPLVGSEPNPRAA